MKSLQLILVAALAAGSMAMASCGAKEDENATVVNIEKGVAPPVSTQEIPGNINGQEMETPVGIITSGTPAELEGSEAEAPAEDAENTEAEPPATDKEKKAE